ncbi:MAG: alpha-N-acetylglucosaminidase [Rikenellaceae bacterium]|nr:alpha-N-acetylglucosaminidase [Rikenellaceae bacterium]MCL2693325.1 alpha-N-acetylglucosaminidase [Rikenellaceae bacterium]
MKTLTVILLALLFCGCSQVQNSGADDLIQRVSRGTATNIVTEIALSPEGCTRDFFEISARDGNVLIRGNNTVSIATGFNWYLKYTVGVHITWNNLTQELPVPLPLPTETIRHFTDLPLRYYLNYCTFSYTMAFWNWERWEQELDWMAMRGINLPLAITGSETVWRNLLKRMGHTADEVNEFISGPAFMAWWLMSNLEGWGGPNPDEWYENQETLQKKIIARMRELGIEPVLPGYAGMVPRNIGGKLGFEVADQGKWCGFDRPAFLRPDSPDFDKFADMYYEELEKLYGRAKYYSIDPFHEGGSTRGIDLDAAGRTIMGAMKRAAPDGVWVLQAWQANPRMAMIENLDAGDLLVLDLYSEKMPQWGDPRSQWYRPEGFGKYDWLYCMLLNFGGRVGLHGRMDRLIDGFYMAQEHPNGRTLRGVGTTAEGIENNPVMFELLYELPWRAEKFTKEEWLDSYIPARYGRYDATVRKAWELLAENPYNCPDDYPGEGTVESLFCARPQINPTRVSTWGSSLLFYDPDVTREAARLLLSVADRFADSENFNYDLVDVMRQSIADHANKLSREIAEAHKAGDVGKFRALADKFLEALLCQDHLLATQRDFRLGNWLEQARALSQVPEYQNLYEWNARTLITVWGPRVAAENSGLRDYSNREWNGLLADFYYPRWERFFDNTVKEMRGETVVPIDFFAMDEAWTHERKAYGAQAEGDLVQVAREVFRKVFGDR